MIIKYTVIDILFRHMIAKFHRFWLKMGMLCMNLYIKTTGMKNGKKLICTPLGTFAAFCYMFNVFWAAITRKLKI